VLQDGEFERLGSSHTIKTDVRIIAATNRDLEKEVQNGHFRKDLWYRLNVFPIMIPPLRQRTKDIPLLVNYFVNKFGIRQGKSIKIIPQGVMESLENYSWPGNIRELSNVIERAVINSRSSVLSLMEKLSQDANIKEDERKSLTEIEREYIVKTLKETKWRVDGLKGAALILGLNSATLRSRMRKLGIHRLLLEK
jgi:transcriptional regulator with GAF, ATPase, and Fis domain